MLSKTSSCERTLRRADWRRFWPLLFLYGAVWMMLLPLGLWNRRWSVQNAETVQDILRSIENPIYDCVTAAVPIAAVFAVLLAMTLYGYLMNGRSVGLMHALPVNRTKQFFNHFRVGVEIFTIVHVATFVVSVLVMSGYGVISWEGILTWFAVAELNCLFFFSLATLCAMVTGWVIAIPVIYVGVNAMFVVFYSLLQLMFSQFYWGYSNSGYPELISWLTPFERLLNTASDTYVWRESPGYAEHHLSAEGWTALIVYTVVAAVFVAVAWLFYKARRSESAGDAIVFDWLRPIVLYVISVVGGMGFGYLLYYLIGLDNSDSLLLLLLCQIVSGVVVYFAVQMLLQKSFKVFNRRGWLGAVLLAVILIVIAAVVKFDLLGYERYVPAEDKVASVEFRGSMMSDYTYNDEASRIEKITAIHAAILAQGQDDPADELYPGEDAGVWHNFSFTYHMSNGTRIHRNYALTVQPGSELHELMNEFLNARGVYAESFFRGYDYDFTDHITGGYYHNWRDEAYGNEVIIDAATGEVTAVASSPVREQQLTKAQAQALHRAVGEHIERKDSEFIDALYYWDYDDTKRTTFNLEFRGRPEQYEAAYYASEMPVDAGYADEWYLDSIPADCTEVMDLIIEFGLANSYDDLLYPEEEMKY
ncbi:MAG: hypothetical protein IKV99_06770 [Oscillospiraceae bacterium]|nr:hypothetical protein [Oscillospiraceae bacterium]